MPRRAINGSRSAGIPGGRLPGPGSDLPRGFVLRMWPRKGQAALWVILVVEVVDGVAGLWLAAPHYWCAIFEASDHQCARVATGHTAAPQTTVRNWRLFIAPS